MAGSIHIPIIDLDPFLKGNEEDRVKVAEEIASACEEIGFFLVRNHGVDPNIIKATWDVTTEFFDLSDEEKMQYCKPQEEYPFGYNAMGHEVLSAGKAAETKTTDTAPPDLKEMFSIGPSNPAAGMPPRLLPTNPPTFAAAWDAYYNAVNELANKLLQAFAMHMKLPLNYFEQFTDHHASAMRALNYPVIEGYEPLPGQLRASAHTDYGTITILKSGGPGLQVSKDRDPPVWTDVPFLEDCFIVNLGDLMRRWTNDRWQSTLHRVIIPPKGSVWGRRQSIAFFHNLNKDARVVVLGDEAPKYEPIVAGEFLMQKHLAAMSKK